MMIFAKALIRANNPSLAIWTYQLGIVSFSVLSSGMKQYCGRSFKVEHIRPSINDEHWIYTLDDGPPFPFTEDMFVFTSPVPASTISFDDLMKGAT